MNRFMLAALVGVSMAAVSRAHAQSFNIEFGVHGSSPAPDYAAAGLPGVWNTFGVLSSSPQPILTITGANTGVTIKNIGGTALVSADDPATAGGDQLLMDDMLIGLSNPLDACLFIDGIQSGDYEVIIYAKTPMSTDLNSVRVDFATPGAQWVGGAWTGSHEEGVTYARFTLTVTDGNLDFHSGMPNGNFQSGINGVQVRRIIEGDLNGDGIINVNDRSAFCAALGNSLGEPGYDMYADLNDDGVIDHLDQAQFNELLTQCVGDLVDSDTFLPPADGFIDGADLAILLGAWGNRPSCADFVTSKSFAPPPDGKVDGADLAVLLGAWGPCN